MKKRVIKIIVCILVFLAICLIIFPFVEFKKMGNICETEYLLEEEYINNVIEKALYNKKILILLN